MRCTAGLWLCLSLASVAQAGPALTPRCPWHQQQVGNACYAFVRHQYSFWAAQVWCQTSKGHLAHVWMPEMHEVLGRRLAEGEKWWIGLVEQPSAKKPGSSAHRVDAAATASPPSCSYLIKVSGSIWARRDTCAQKLYFICQFDTAPERNSSAAHPEEESKRETEQENTRLDAGTRTDFRLAAGLLLQRRDTAVAWPAHSCQKKMCTRIQAAAGTAAPVQTATLAPAARPATQPATPGSATRPATQGAPLEPATRPAAPGAPLQPPTPGPALQPAMPGTPLQSLSTGAATTLQDLNVAPFTVNSWIVLQEASSERNIQSMEETMKRFNQAIRNIHHLPALQRACYTLQNLTKVPRWLSEAAQKEASESLLFLSTHLLRALLGSNSSSTEPSGPVANALFQSFSNLLMAMDGSTPTSSWAQHQLEAVVENTMAALPEIQALLWEGSCTMEPESSVMLVSPIASTMLSSCNISTLSLGSYRLTQPLPLTLAFPSAPALAALFSNRSHLQVGVTVLAINPFKRLDRTEIRSVGNIILAAREELIAVRDLPEDIEVGLWRDKPAEMSPSVLNASTKALVIELNITSVEGALIVRVLPDVPLMIELCLGYQHLPNNTHCLVNTTLPTHRGQHEGDNYTWVLSSARLQPSLGPYHIKAVARQSTDQELLNHVTYTVTVLTTQCHFWDQQRKVWRQEGCQVGPQSTISSTQCLCNHLTFFGSSVFIVPRTVNIQDTGKLLQNIANNPVGVALLASLLVVHGAAGIWAWRRDRADMQKVKVTVLADSDPRAHVRYVIQVFTGYRRGAATTAKVVLTLYGSEGRSEPHCLQDPHKPVFERGGLDVFLVTTHHSLGELHSIRVWHDNSGPSPSWYVRQIVVSDVASRKKWHFLCSTWLAVDLGDCQLDQVFPAASRSELLSCRQLFHSALVEKVTQEHLWLSVLTRCPWDPFTRAQRLACCLTLLLCTMLINLMFWRGPPGAEGQEPAGQGLLTWSELVASVQTALVLFPINLVIVHIFQLVPPEDLPLPPTGIRLPRASALPGTPCPLTRLKQELKEIVGFLSRTKLCLESEALPQELENVPELVCSLCWLIRSYLQGTSSRGGEPHLDNVSSCQLSTYLSHMLELLKAQLQALGLGGLHDTHISQLQNLQVQLEQHSMRQEPGLARAGRSFHIPEPTEQKASITSWLPKETLFVCWVTVAVASLASAFFTILLSLQLDRQQATSWVVSMLLSLLQNIFIMQPLKVSGLTLLFSLVLKRVLWQDKRKEQQLQRILALLARCPSLELPGSRNWNDPIYIPPHPRPMTPRRGTIWREKLYAQLGEILVQVVFLASLMVVSYTERSPHELYFNQALRQSLTRNFSHIHSLGDFYSWAHGTLLPSLYGPTPGLTADGNAFLLGSVRLRQLRPQTQDELCSCHHQDIEGWPSWGPPGQSTEGQDSIWVHHSIASLGEYPVWGQLNIYPGAGYLAYLGTNSSSAHSMLRYLEQNWWLDGCSCAIFVEFTVYNANVNLFCVVTLLLETSGMGAFLPSAELQSIRAPSSSIAITPLACAQVSYLLLLLLSVLVQAWRLKQQKWRYYRSQRNVLDVSIILISLTAIGVYAKRHLLQMSVMQKYQQDRSRFVSFYEAAKMDSALICLLAFLVVLTMMKLWKLLHLNPRMHLISQTLHGAWQEVVGFLLVLLVLLAGYSMACNLLFGWSIENYKTVVRSAVTIVELLIGIFNYDTVLDLDPVLGSLLITTSVVSMLYVVINLFVSALLTTFSEEREAALANKDESITELMLLKLSSLMGVRRQAQQ